MGLDVILLAFLRFSVKNSEQGVERLPAQLRAREPDGSEKRALELDPGFLQAHLALGKLYLRAYRFQDAAGELESVVRADSKLAEAYYQLSRAYTRLKRREDAQRAATKFEQLSNDQKQQSENERREIVRRLANVRY